MKDIFPLELCIFLNFQSTTLYNIKEIFFTICDRHLCEKWTINRRIISGFCTRNEKQGFWEISSPDVKEGRILKKVKKKKGLE